MNITKIEQLAPEIMSALCHIASPRYYTLANQLRAAMSEQPAERRTGQRRINYIPRKHGARSFVDRRQNNVAAAQARQAMAEKAEGKVVPVAWLVEWVENDQHNTPRRRVDFEAYIPVWLSNYQKQNVKITPLAPAPNNAAPQPEDIGEGTLGTDTSRIITAAPDSRHIHANSNFLLTFADQDRGFCCYDNRDDAIRAFARASDQWTCSLYEAIGISGAGPELAKTPAPSNAEERRKEQRRIIPEGWQRPLRDGVIDRRQNNATATQGRPVDTNGTSDSPIIGSPVTGESARDSASAAAPELPLSAEQINQIQISMPGNENNNIGKVLLQALIAIDQQRRVAELERRCLEAERNAAFDARLAAERGEKLSQALQTARDKLLGWEKAERELAELKAKFVDARVI